MGVREAQARIGADEFAEWLAYGQLEPWGPEREDLRAAIVAATVASTLTGRRFRPADFMPRFGAPRRADPHEMHATMRLFAEAHNEHHRQSRRQAGG